MKNLKFVVRYLRNWSFLIWVRDGMETLEVPVDMSQLIFRYHYFFLLINCNANQPFHRSHSWYYMFQAN